MSYKIVLLNGTSDSSMRIAALLFSLFAMTAHAKDRVTDARARRGTEIAELISKAGLSAKPTEVYLRVLKRERQVELWAGPKGKPLSLVKTYAICAASGELGPKRAEGDLQVPEGFYDVPEFNSTSSYHLSMKVSYPNASDKIRTSNRAHPGGLIYMHGDCVSIGCVAIEDAQIEEVYLISLDATVRRIDIFPTRLTAATIEAMKDEALFGFWRELAPAYIQFEKTRRPARYTIDPKTGEYRVITQ